MEVHWNYIFFEKYMYILFFYLRRWIFWNPTLLLKRIKFNSYLLNLVSKNGTGINMPHSVTFNTYCFKLAYCAFKDTRVLYIDWNFLVLKTDHMLNDNTFPYFEAKLHEYAIFNLFFNKWLWKGSQWTSLLFFQILNFQNTSALPQLF